MYVQFTSCLYRGVDGQNFKRKITKWKHIKVLKHINVTIMTLLRLIFVSSVQNTNTLLIHIHTTHSIYTCTVYIYVSRKFYKKSSQQLLYLKKMFLLPLETFLDSETDSAVVLKINCSQKFCKIYGKHLQWSDFNKNVGQPTLLLKSSASLEMFSCKFCDIFGNSFSADQERWLLERCLMTFSTNRDDKLICFQNLFSIINHSA